MFLRSGLNGLTEQNVRVSLTRNWDIHQLAVNWQCLELRAKPNAFISWFWISHWLSICDKKPLLLCAYRNEIPVAMGLFTDKIFTPFPGIKIKQLWLHKTGQPEDDQVWIEHNDFLLDDENGPSREALISFLLSQDYDEVHVGLSSEELLLSIPQHYRQEIVSTSYSLDLKNIASKKSYLDSISKSVKKQIIRSEKILEQTGHLALRQATDKDEKALFFEEMAEFHRQRWADSEYGSGFDNNKFFIFHKSLIIDDVDNSKTKLFQLIHNNRVYGYIYLLCDKNAWKFYLSAIKTDNDNRIKIGLLFHTLIIEQATHANILNYDFLAGEARYKSELSKNSTSVQSLICFYNPKPIIMLRELLRKIKRHIWSIRKKQQHA